LKARKDSSSSGPTEVAFELKPSGKKATMEGPDSVKAGVARITLKNSTKDDGSAQLVRVEGDHSANEVLAAGEAWGDKGKPLPDWLRLIGGVPNAPPGTSETATQVLAPGKYMAADLESNGVAEFEVTGDAEGELPAPSASIDAAEYSFESSGFKAGEAKVAFSNGGKEPHFVVGVPIKQGKTIDDVRAFIRTEKGEPPLDENDPNGFDSPVLDGGEKQVLTLKLKKGSYALMCFIPDRKGGPPHVAKGMVSEAVVE
jgi:hypothetical protein